MAGTWNRTNLQCVLIMAEGLVNTRGCMRARRNLAGRLVEGNGQQLTVILVALKAKSRLTGRDVSPV